MQEVVTYFLRNVCTGFFVVRKNGETWYTSSLEKAQVLARLNPNWEVIKCWEVVK
jgi:hypothetical protein